MLPDSRAKRAVGAVVVDWPMPNGSTVRLEAVPVYCANCGKPYGFVPRDNTTFSFWLCRKCFETHGAIAGTMAVSDEEFRRAVQEEIRARFGRDMTAEELADADLGPALEALVRDSPHRS